MAVEVRKATRDDAPRIAELALDLFDLHTAWNPRRFTGVATREGATCFYGERTKAENAAVLVAEEDGRVIGFAYLEYEPVLYAELAVNVAWLHDILVEGEARSGGAGKMLIEAASREAKGLGANKILLTVAAQNGEARAFFEHEGFRTTMYEMMLEID